MRELKAEIREELAAAWLREAREVGRYLLAAQARREGRPDAPALAEWLDPGRLERLEAALRAEKAPLEDLLSPWRSLASAGPSAFAAEGRKLAERYAKEDREREKFNAEGFVTFADFRSGGFAGWQASGQALREGAGRSGDFALNPEGEALVRAVLPAGCFTHAISDKLNGALRSPPLPGGIKHISFQVMGRRSSAVRLVSNNCQLNYRNYRALTTDELQWVTFEPPEDSEGLARLRRADDDVRQPEVPRPAQRPGRRQGELPPAVGGGGGEPALVLRRHAGRGPRRRRASPTDAEPPPAALRRSRPGLAGRPGRPLCRGRGVGRPGVGRRPGDRRRRAMARRAAPARPARQQHPPDAPPGITGGAVSRARSGPVPPPRRARRRGLRTRHRTAGLPPGRRHQAGQARPPALPRGAGEPGRAIRVGGERPARAGRSGSPAPTTPSPPG